MLRYRRITAAAWLLLMLCLLVAAPRVALAQSLLTEPDFGGMYRPDANARVVARDSARGWTYLALAGDVSNSRVYFINGVRSAPLVRVNDAGVVDAGWVVDDAVAAWNAMVLGNGDLLIYDTAWRRLVRGSDGVLRAQTLAQPYEPGALAQAFPTARDAAGNVYLLYSRTAGSPVDALRRIAPNGEPDTSWRLQLDLSFGKTTHVAIAADNSVYYVASNITPPFSVGEPGASTLVHHSAADGLRWTRPFTGKPLALTTDSTGRGYLLGNALNLSGKTGSVLRVDAAGGIDTAWGVATTATPAPSAGAICVRDGAVLAAALQDGEPLASVALTRVPLAGGATATGTLAASPRAQPVCDGGQIAVRATRSVAITSAGSSAIDTRQVAAVAGTPAIVARIERWGDYFVVAGQFEYWFEGLRYSNLMRVRGDLRPDTSWRPEIAGRVRTLAVDAAGGLLVGGDALTDAQTPLLRFGADGQRDARFNRAIDGPVLALATASNGELYVGGRFSAVDGSPRASLARLAADGRLDAAWAPGYATLAPGIILQPSYAFSVPGVVVANADEVVVTWLHSNGVTGSEGLSRIDRHDPAVGRALTDTLTRVKPGSLVRDDSTGWLFALRQRNVAPFGTELVAIDSLTLSQPDYWTPFVPFATVASVAAFDGSRIYLQDGSQYLRNGVADGRWSPYTITHGGRVPAPLAGDAVAWPALGAPFAVRMPTAAIGPRTVVEYIAKDANRFFITARPSEQAQLDALPSFARTGMQFQAFDGSIVPPAAPTSENTQPAQALASLGAQPACRFFSPRERGGSGTHFYGVRGDCQLLNTFAGFINEGYDFALHPAKAGTCPAATPIAVYRLFNNRAAQNDGNHRYVVSSTRRDEMLARGWIDEGVVFCVSTATDSRAFGNW